MHRHSVGTACLPQTFEKEDLVGDIRKCHLPDLRALNDVVRLPANGKSGQSSHGECLFVSGLLLGRFTDAHFGPSGHDDDWVTRHERFGALSLHHCTSLPIF